MRWWWTGLLCAAVGCSARSLPLPISIVGLHDVTKANDLIFLTSTDQNELRVLSLDLDPSVRDFVRAPNPIEPLSVPVVGRPEGVTHDVTWQPDPSAFDAGMFPGSADAGYYVYVQAAADQEISLVSVARTDLFEVCRLETSGTVTAIAARAPDVDAPSVSTLYFATTEGAQSSLWQADVPPPPQVARVWSGDHYQCVVNGPAQNSGAPVQVKLLVNLLQESIVATEIVPQGTRRLLALSTHSANGAGRSLLLDPITLSQRPLNFPSPTRALFVPPATTDLLGQYRPPGERIFGILDESVCDNRPACNGVVAVDAVSGDVSVDWGALPMLNLGVSGALLTGLSLAPSAAINIPTASTGLNPVVTEPMLGILSASNGLVYFFDAESLVFLDADPATATVVDDATGNPVLSYTLPDGGLPSIIVGTGPVPATIKVADGAANNQTITITYQGVLPGLSGLPPGSGAAPFVKPAGTAWAEAETGDFIELASSNPACTGAAAELSVLSVGPNDLTANATVPAECEPLTSFSIRAGGVQPFMVLGTLDGYMGRVAPGSPSATCSNLKSDPPGDPSAGCFQFTGTYYAHPPSTTIGQPVPLQYALAFQMGALDLSMARDGAYSFSVLSHFSPLYLSVDATRFGTGYQLPGPSAFDYNLQRAYVSFPGANAIMEIALDQLAPNQANYLNLQPYR